MAGGREGLPSSPSSSSTWIGSNPALIQLFRVCAPLPGCSLAHPVPCQASHWQQAVSKGCAGEAASPEAGPMERAKGQGWAGVDIRHSLSPASTAAPLNQRHSEQVLLCVCRSPAGQPNLIGNGGHRPPPASDLHIAGEIPLDPFSLQEFQANISLRLCK